MDDAYAVCRYVRHYHQKNGYAPLQEHLPVSLEFFQKLVDNGIVVLRAQREGGPPIGVVLTEKGRRMSDTHSRARKGRSP